MAGVIVARRERVFRVAGVSASRFYLRRTAPLEAQVQQGVLELLRRMPNEVAWCHKQPAGSFVIVRRDPSSELSVRKQLEAAARAGFIKASQIAWIQAAPEGVLDIALQLAGSGVHAELEVKQPGAKPTDAQRERMKLVRENGGLADWVDDIDDVIPLIKKWRKKHAAN